MIKSQPRTTALGWAACGAISLSGTTAFAEGDASRWTFEDLSWSVTALAGCKVGEKPTLRFGHRIHDMDYSDGLGADEFAFDATQHGPFFGLSHRF